jgi:hypothetical protein
MNTKGVGPSTILAIPSTTMIFDFVETTQVEDIATYNDWC